MADLSPLHERVEAPHRLALPIHPDIAQWRALRLEDVPALARLHVAADAVDHPEWLVPERELRERLERRVLDLERDTIAGVTASGAIVAYGINLIDQHPVTILRVLLDGAIDPSVRGRGIGRELLQWQRGRAQQQLAASDLPLPGWILSWQTASNNSGVNLAKLLGFRPARYVASLIRDLAAPVVERETDASVRILPWSDSLSAAALDAHRAAFRDHWGSQPTSDETWRGQTTPPNFRQQLSFLAVAADEPGTVVAYVLASVYEHDFGRQGYSSVYIELVGTRREWRGKGIARALLARALEAAQRLGLEKAVLDVDTENPTGALGLYEAQGFRPNGRRQVALVLSY